jgi:hypothetical protein
MACNFAASAEQLFQSWQTHADRNSVCPVRMISFQFPDPWRRGKHKKRLIIQPKLVLILAKYLPDNAVVYLSSDCDDVMALMVSTFVCDEKCTGYFEMMTTGEILDNVASEGDPQGLNSDGIFSGSFIVPESSKFKSGRSPVDTKIDGSQLDAEFIHPDEAFSLLTSNGNLTSGAGLTQQQREQQVRLEQQQLLQRIIQQHEAHWVPFNPLNEPSERELVCEVDWRRVWRCCLRRTKKVFLGEDIS